MQPNNPCPNLQLHLLVDQPHLLSRLERRETNIRTTITPKSVSEATIAAAADFAFDRKVNFRQVVGVQLQAGERFVCI